MESVLMQLYKGKISPEATFAPETEEYKRLRREHYHYYESFIKKLHSLNPPLGQQFISIMDEQLTFLPYDNAQAFIDGFRLGAKIMLEVLHQPEQQP